jgi:hypothetical protein
MSRDRTRNVHTISFLGGRPVRLNRQGPLDHLFFDVRLFSTLVQHQDRSWSTEISGWMYQVMRADLRELFAYHWHPSSRSLMIRPHFHISGRTDPAELGDAHYPTGVITLADVVRLLIEDFQVRPRRADWSRTLDAAAA